MSIKIGKISHIQEKTRMREQKKPIALARGYSDGWRTAKAVESGSEEKEGKALQIQDGTRTRKQEEQVERITLVDTCGRSDVGER